MVDTFELMDSKTSEIEILLRSDPELAKAFFTKCSNKDEHFVWDELTPAERGIAMRAYIETGLDNPEILNNLISIDYARPPIDIDDILDDPQYLGKFSKEIYPRWKEDLRYVLDPKNQIYEFILGGSIGSGKTQTSIVAQLYKLANLTCLKNIPGYFGLASNTLISFGFFTLTLTKGEDALSRTFREIISGSPYFRNIFPQKKRRSVKKVMNTSGAKSDDDYEILLPGNLQVLVGSKTNHALSLAMVSAVLDEMNFRGRRSLKEEDDQDSAEKLYEEIRSRITSRFNRLGHSPGLLCVISSKKTQSDFLEAHIASVKNDPHTHVSSYSLWDVKPEKYSKERFKVFIGSSKAATKILTEEEASEYPEDHPQILEVPTSLRREFEKDVNVAVRQLGGVTAAPTYLLFDNPLVVTKMWSKDRVSPFSREIIETGIAPGNRTPLKEFLVPNELIRDAGFAIVPRYHPDAHRTIHIDLAATQDRVGMSMGCVPWITEARTKDNLGRSSVSSLHPHFWIDFAVAISAPQGDQINFEEIQRFVNYLRSCRFIIDYVTYDTWQSIGSVQMLKMDNFEVGKLSVDRTDVPYMFLRDAFSAKAISCYRHKILERELLNLKRDISGKTTKIDHPKLNSDGTRGSKDVSDSLAGVAFNLYEMLTNSTKFPNTANSDLVAGVFTTMNKEEPDTAEITNRETQDDFTDYENEIRGLPEKYRKPQSKWFREEA